MPYFAFNFMVKKQLKYEIEEYLQFIAIASPLKDYRAAFFVNEKLCIDLKLDEELSIDYKAKSEVHSFSRFFYEDDLSGLSYHLVQNKCEKGVLIKTLKQFDFILIIKRYEEEAIDISSLTSKLKSINDFQIALVVENIKKSEYNLVLKNLAFSEERENGKPKTNQ